MGRPLSQHNNKTMRSYKLLKNTYVRSLTIGTVYIFSIYSVTSFLAPNIIGIKNVNILQRKTSFPRNKMPILKDFKTLATKIAIKGEKSLHVCKNKNTMNLIENDVLLEPTNAKAAWQNMSLLSVLVAPSSGIEIFKKKSLTLITSFIIFSVAFSKRSRNALYPGSSKDESFNEHLPTGKLT